MLYVSNVVCIFLTNPDVDEGTHEKVGIVYKLNLRNNIIIIKFER